MTARCRPLQLLAAFATLGLPACLTIETHTRPTPPPEPRERPVAKPIANVKPPEPIAKSEFGVYPPFRPGESARIHPGAGDAAKDTTTAKKPTAGPEPSGGSDADVKVIAYPPDPFPKGLAAPASAESRLVAAVRAHADGRAADGLDALKALPPASQEFVIAVLPILFRGVAVDLAADPVASAELAEQLRGATAQLEPRAALRVENVVFCKRVDAFGRYDPRPNGQPYGPNDQAQLYLEVHNLVSQPATGPHGETHLTHARASVVIRDAHGDPVEQPDPNDWRRRVKLVQYDVKRYTRGPIRDFHMLYPFTVPSTPGVYTVTVELRDPSGRRTVRSTAAEFRVAGP